MGGRGGEGVKSLASEGERTEERPHTHTQTEREKNEIDEYPAGQPPRQHRCTRLRVRHGIAGDDDSDTNNFQTTADQVKTNKKDSDEKCFFSREKRGRRWRNVCRGGACSHGAGEGRKGGRRAEGREG